MPLVAFLRFLRSANYQLKRWFLWRGRCCPGRMYRSGRPIDNPIPELELLFFRCAIDWIDVCGAVKPANVHFPDQSVNRAKYGKPTDVLLPDWIHWGVVRLMVSDVPSSMSTDGNVSYEFTAEHDPQEKNFGHAELRVYKNQKRETKSSKVNTKIKKQYRTIVAMKSTVILQPLI